MINTGTVLETILLVIIGNTTGRYGYENPSKFAKAFKDGFDMFQEIFAFLFSFSLWEGFDSLIYNLSDTRYEVGNVTQNLLLEVVFMEDIKENEENIENII